MKTVKVSEFKAKFLGLLAEVAESGESLLVTKRGHPIARVLPAPDAAEGNWLGAMEGTAEIQGDLMEPVTAPEAWEALDR